MFMNINTNIDRNKNFQRYIYCLYAVLLILFSFYFYINIVSSVFGMVLLFMQGAIFYCILKVFPICNFRTVLISLIFTFIIFLFMELINVFIPNFRYSNQNLASSFIVIIWYVLSVCIAIFLFSIWKRDNYSYHNKMCFYLVVCILIGIFTCAFRTDNMKTYQINSNIFLFAFLIIHCEFSYYICNCSNKFLIIGNILIAFYFASTQLYMINFCTKEISNTGWAISYILFLAKKYFIVHTTISVVVLLFALTIKRLYQKKCNLYK